MLDRRKNIVHGNLPLVESLEAFDLNEVEFCRMRAAS